ncbi:hypothetical protein IPH67_00090 [bacterium]|nr:MAG: hypothetical protein IPH67_00090 [bacterium]
MWWIREIFIWSGSKNSTRRFLDERQREQLSEYESACRMEQKFNLLLS